MSRDVRERVGRFGIWHRGHASPELARGLEAAGYGTLWLGGSPPGDLRLAEELLDATTSLTLATGIVNIWSADARAVAAAFARVRERHGDRFVLGIGVGHREASSGYRSPFASLSAYVDVLLAEGVPQDSLVLAALGPRVLQLAGERTAGAHPFLVTPEHTRRARGILGTAPLLAPEQKVVLETDPARARALGRPVVATPYLGMANYTANLRRLGWSDADLADGGSDALIDALVAHGSPEAVAARLREHLDAGADHVAVRVVTAPDEDPLASARVLAEVLGG